MKLKHLTLILTGVLITLFTNNVYAQETPVEEEEVEEEFQGFKVNLDSIDGMGALDAIDNDDDDITSLFDSMFDE